VNDYDKRLRRGRYITSHANEIDVVNLSLEGRQNSPFLNDEITKSVNSNVTYVVAAGNGDMYLPNRPPMDASKVIPANHPLVITVSAIADSDGKCGGIGLSTSAGGDDEFYSNSNYGSVVDIAAPGVDIMSTLPSNTYGLDTGTSMAAPHVSGAVALYKSYHNNSSPAEVKEAILKIAMKKENICNLNNNDGQGYTNIIQNNHNEPLLNAKDIE
jgi:subtilisin